MRSGEMAGTGEEGSGSRAPTISTFMEDRLTPQPRGPNPSSLLSVYFISILAFNLAQVRVALGSLSP